MSDVTFTPEQVREIRRRIEAQSTCHCPGCDAGLEVTLGLFPLPKVTRFRTFTSRTDTYRVHENMVEYWSEQMGVWLPPVGRETCAAFAASLVKLKDWTALAAFADVCANPTEEVDA